MKRVIPAYKTLVEVLQDALDKEKDAVSFYREAAEMADEGDIRAFLLQLAEMESEHAGMIQQRLDSLQSDKRVMDGILSSYGEDSEDDS